MARRNHDFYPTPEWATKVLLEHCPDIYRCSDGVVEPCAGDGAIADCLYPYFQYVHTLDIDPTRKVDKIYDARYLTVSSEEAVITNPPFNQAIEIVQNFVQSGAKSAFLLRLSFLEPTFARGKWLQENPPAGLIILPRISFTGDGKTDSVTCAWMVWNMRPFGVIVHPKTTNS